MIECAPSLVQMIASLVQLQWRAVFVLLVALVAKGRGFDEPLVLIHKRRVFFGPSSGHKSNSYHFYIRATKIYMNTKPSAPKSLPTTNAAKVSCPHISLPMPVFD